MRNLGFVFFVVVVVVVFLRRETENRGNGVEEVKTPR